MLFIHSCLVGGFFFGLGGGILEFDPTYYRALECNIIVVVIVVIFEWLAAEFCCMCTSYNRITFIY